MPRPLKLDTPPSDIFMSEKQADVALDFSIPGRQASLEPPLTPDPYSRGDPGSPTPSPSPPAPDHHYRSRPDVDPASPQGGDTARSLRLDAILDAGRQIGNRSHAHPQYEPHLALPGTLPGTGIGLAEYTMRLMRAFPSSFLGQKPVAASGPADVYAASGDLYHAAADPYPSKADATSAAPAMTHASQSVFCEPTTTAGAMAVQSTGRGPGERGVSPSRAPAPPQEDPVYWERRRKNNEAAKRSRDARRAKEDEISMRASLLEHENLRLKVEVATLKTETNKLRWLLYSG